MKLLLQGNLATRRKSLCARCIPSQAQHAKINSYSLRLMFAVTDLQETDDQEYVGEGEEAEEAMPTYPLRASLAVTKTDTPGALNIDMAVQEGQFEVDNISFYNDKSIGTELTAEADWKRRGLYIGPQVSDPLFSV